MIYLFLIIKIIQKNWQKIFKKKEIRFTNWEIRRK